MRSIVGLYLAYLELIIISMIVVTLIFISVSGLTFGGDGLLPATLAIITLSLIGFIVISRRNALAEHPELKRRPFGEFRLFLFILEKKFLKVADSLNLVSRKKAVRYSGWIAGAMLAVLLISAIWWSFSISADISLRRNQARVTVRPPEPATIFNRAVIIEVLETSAEANGHPARVTAIIKSEGYPEMKVEGEGIGYTTTYAGRFLIRILDANDSTAKFFVERLEDGQT